MSALWRKSDRFKLLVSISAIPRSVPYEFIMQVTVVSKREFVVSMALPTFLRLPTSTNNPNAPSNPSAQVSSVQPFTKTGLYEVRV